MGRPARLPAILEGDGRPRRRQRKIQSRKTQPRKTQQRKTRPSKTRQGRKRRIRVIVPRPTRAETLLLALAKDLAGAPLDGALRRLADAFAPTAELPREVYGAWGKSRRRRQPHWPSAGERARLSLEETIARAEGAPALGLAPDTLAWLLLAARRSPTSRQSGRRSRSDGARAQRSRRAGRLALGAHGGAREHREAVGPTDDRGRGRTRVSAPRRFGARQDHDRAQSKGPSIAPERDAEARAPARPHARHDRGGGQRSRKDDAPVVVAEHRGHGFRDATVDHPEGERRNGEQGRTC